MELVEAEMSGSPAAAAEAGDDERAAVDALVTLLFRKEVRSLVRLARFFVDDTAAAEDLVQEAFIRLARSAQRLREQDKAAAYLRAIVLNLARDHNRRGLVSLRHRPPADPAPASVEEQAAVRADQQQVVAALRELPRRQRDCWCCATTWSWAWLRSAPRWGCRPTRSRPTCSAACARWRHGWR
jgi:RNA polymerase sigma factor (sigma-70 family)